MSDPRFFVFSSSRREMFGKKKERHKSGEALNVEENGTSQQSLLNPGTSLREQGDIIEGRDELTPETR